MAAAPTYVCADCGLSVIVLPEKEPIRACPHDDAAILAQLSSTCAGFGGVRV